MEGRYTGSKKTYPYSKAAPSKPCYETSYRYRYKHSGYAGYYLCQQCPCPTYHKTDPEQCNGFYDRDGYYHYYRFKPPKQVQYTERASSSAESAPPVTQADVVESADSIELKNLMEKLHLETSVDFPKIPSLLQNLGTDTIVKLLEFINSSTSDDLECFKAALNYIVTAELIYDKEDLFNIFQYHIPLQLILNLGIKVITCKQKTISFLKAATSFPNKFKALFQHDKFEEIVETFPKQLILQYGLDQPAAKSSSSLEEDKDEKPGSWDVEKAIAELLGSYGSKLTAEELDKKRQININEQLIAYNEFQINKKIGQIRYKRDSDNYLRECRIIKSEFETPLSVDSKFIAKFKDINHFINGTFLDDSCDFVTFLDRFEIVHRLESKIYTIKFSKLKTISSASNPLKTNEVIVTIIGGKPIISTFYIHIHPNIKYTGPNSSNIHPKLHPSDEDHAYDNAANWRFLDPFRVAFKK